MTHSAPRQLHGEAALFKQFFKKRSFVSLDQDTGAFNRAAHAAFSFQFAGEFFEFRCRQWNTGDEGNGFAISALGLSLESNDTITIRLKGLALA